LKQYVQHVEPGDLPSLAGCFPFQYAEVGRHGDDYVPDLLAGLILRGPGQLAQDQRGDRLRGVVLAVEGVVDVFTHLPFD